MRHNRRKSRLLSPTNIQAGGRRVQIGDSPGLPPGISKLILLKEDAHICIVRKCGGLGDVLMITPALRELKRLHPLTKLTVAVDRHSTGDDHYHGVLQNAPFIDEIVDARYVIKKEYDKVIDISAVCIAHERKQLPAVNRINLFAAYIGLPSVENPVPFYQVKEEEAAQAATIISRLRERGGPIIALHAASNDTRRTWAANNQRSFIKWITSASPKTTFIVFDLGNLLRIPSTIGLDSIGSIYDASKTTVREMAALIQQCDLFVGPDSGPMHLAGALGVPSVVVFGAIPPQARINHYPTHKAVVLEGLRCLGCWYEQCPIKYRCMTALPGDIVGIEALKQLRTIRVLEDAKEQE